MGHSVGLQCFSFVEYIMPQWALLNTNDFLPICAVWFSTSSGWKQPHLILFYKRGKKQVLSTPFDNQPGQNYG